MVPSQRPYLPARSLWLASMMSLPWISPLSLSRAISPDGRSAPRTSGVLIPNKRIFWLSIQ